MHCLGSAAFVDQLLVPLLGCCWAATCMCFVLYAAHRRRVAVRTAGSLELGLAVSETLRQKTTWWSVICGGKDANDAVAVSNVGT